MTFLRQMLWVAPQRFRGFLHMVPHLAIRVRKCGLAPAGHRSRVGDAAMRRLDREQNDHSAGIANLTGLTSGLIPETVKDIDKSS